jgi:hypothetical protein
MFSKLTNMACVIPSRDHNLRQIFKEKVPGTDQDRIGQQLIAYLKWLIYVAAYEDSSMLAHEEFYQKQIVIFQNPETYKVWRTLLYKELDEWYNDHPPASKKHKSTGGASRIADVVVGGDEFLKVDIDNFVDLLDDDESGAGTAGGARVGPSAATAALAAAASAAAAASMETVQTAVLGPGAAAVGRSART